MSRPVPSGWAMVGGPVDEVEAMRLDAWVEGADEDVADGPTVMVRVVMTPMGKRSGDMDHEWTDLWVGV
jgi:hypothetical protein